MKRTISSYFAISFAVVMITSLISPAKAQPNPGDFIRAGGADASLLMSEYMSPFFKSFGANLNTGWYNTGKVHKLGRPDITVSLNVSVISAADKTFDIAELNLEKARLNDPSNSIASTAFGPNLRGPKMDIYETNPLTGTDTVVGSFFMPQGLNLPVFATPTANLGIGLPFNTEIMVRYIPTVNYGKSGEIGLLGAGIKHDLKQWIPVMKMLPFDWSVALGYTKFKTSYGLDVPSSDTSLNNSGAYDDQMFELETDAFMINTIVSKKILMVTVYGGVGYQTSSSSLGFKGVYPVQSFDSNGNRKTDNIVDPLTAEYKGANSAQATLGLRLKVLIFTLHGQYTFAEYNNFSLGLGLSLGN
jgi:hypothetical protein